MQTFIIFYVINQNLYNRSISGATETTTGPFGILSIKPHWGYNDTSNATCYFDIEMSTRNSISRINAATFTNPYLWAHCSNHYFIAEAYSEPCQLSKIKLFVKIANCWKLFDKNCLTKAIWQKCYMSDRVLYTPNYQYR